MITFETAMAEDGYYPIIVGMWGHQQHSILMGPSYAVSMQRNFLQDFLSWVKLPAATRHAFISSRVRGCRVIGFALRSSVPEVDSGRVGAPLFWGLISRGEAAHGDIECKALRYLFRALAARFVDESLPVPLSDALQVLINDEQSKIATIERLNSLAGEWCEMSAAFTLRNGLDVKKKRNIFGLSSGQLEERYLVLEDAPSSETDWMDVLMRFWASRFYSCPCIIREMTIREGEQMVANIIVSKDGPEQIALMPVSQVITARTGVP